MNIIVGKEFPKKVIPLIEQAKSSIFIVVYDWRWYPDQIGSAIQRFNNSILNSAKRKRKIKVITNRPYINTILPKLNIDAKTIHSKRMLHTKLMIIDSKIAILGSHNYTMNAFTLNHEVSVILQDEEAVKRLILYFNNLWQL